MSTLPPLDLGTGAAFAVVVLGIVNLVAALLSLRASLRYRRYARRAAAAPSAPAAPAPVLLVVPCCGAEESLEENLEALLSLDHARYEVRFVVESAEDGAVPAIERRLAAHPGRGELLVAGPARGCGQKVHNLLAAIESSPPADVLVFADSDGQPRPDWLRRLLAPLSRSEVGVASSYRFYRPEPPRFPVLLRSVWNASVLTLLGDHDRNFAWGGSMAIRRDVFDRIGVAAAWKGALSDDYALTHAVRRAGLRVEFVPGALVASGGNVGFRELLSWCTRQIAITRIYWPALFRIAAATHIFYTSFLLLAPLGGRTGLLLLGSVLALGFWGGRLRARALGELAPPWRAEIDRHSWAYALLVPLASFLTLQAVLRAFASRRIRWRGKLYEMRSPTETRILGPDEIIRGEAPSSDRPGSPAPPEGRKRRA